ncbi:DUF2809 domain-containing protein [Roseivirga sp. BDSF3-8]|uniref:ribosomal maturation YjgA family protein n=1 Tax=Roseivirga sp. BDSF3-8 TaxID=3241598 RepID=UPI003531EA31
MFTFRPRYALLTLFLFIIEVLIALYVRDAIIRPYVGDFLVVMLVYYFFRTFLTFSKVYLALATLLIAYLVEVLQYLNLLGALSLQDNKLARIVLGSSFEWIDMLAYTLGVIVVYWLDRNARL